MFRQLLTTVPFILGLLISAPATVQAMDYCDPRIQERLDEIADEVERGERILTPEEIVAFDQATMATVQCFNQGLNNPGPKEVIRLEMNPFHWRTMLNELVPQTVAIAFCKSDTEGLRSCDDAADHLRIMTKQCSQTVLGLIDLDVYEDVPLNLLQDAFPDAGDPNFTMLARRDGREALQPVRVNGATNPDTVAIVLCPTESRTFGPALRALGSN